MGNCSNINNTQTVSLTSGTITSGFCHTSLQTTYEEFIARTSASLSGNVAAFTAGDDTPSASDQNKLWWKQDASNCNTPLGWFHYNTSNSSWENAHPVKDDEVTTAKILDSNVTTAKLADNAVTLAKLEDGTQGDLIYYGASGAPARLSAGTSGQYLKTQGSAANPVWADVVFGSVNKYSTGWVQTVNSTTVEDGATLTVPHALGTSDVVVQVYANDSGDDSGAQQVVNQEWAGTGSFFFGAYVKSPSSSNVVVQLSAQGYIKGSSSGNTPSTTSWTGDYIKIIVMG